MSRVLVTGGSGFIGSFVVDQLRAAGHEAVIFDLRPSPHHAPGEVPTVIGDVRDYKAVRKAARGCDAIAHLAAAADVGEVAGDPESAERLNARGTFNVLEAAREEGVGRVIYASTVWVYSGTEGRVDEDTPVRPPTHPYTATKLAGELYCRAYSEFYGVDTTILRFGIPYGPRARPAAVVPSFVGRALDGEPLTIAGSGDQTRRFVYVEDLAEGVVRALAPVAANRTYNLVGGADISVREIAGTVCDLVGDARIEHAPARAGDFSGGPDICGERAALELGWHPRTDFRDGVARYVAWRRREAEAAASRRVRLGLSVSNHAVTLLAVAAGAVGAVLTRYDMVTDPVSFIALMALLGLPVALIAGLDWLRDRGRAVVLVAAMLLGVMLQGFVTDRHEAIHEARHHHILILLMVVAAATAAVAARAWRASRAGQGDTAA